MSNERLIASALEKTAPGLYAQVDGGKSWVAAIKKRAARVKKYRAYERGDHDNNLTQQQRKLLNITEDDASLNETSANYCGIIVDKMAGRVSVSEITAEDDAVTEWIESTLERNNFRAKQGEWWRGAIRDCASYVLVDPQTALWTSEPAFDGHSGIVAIFDDTLGTPLWACKMWVTSEVTDISSDVSDSSGTAKINVVVYQPDMITYWSGVEGGEEVRPEPFVLADGSALKQIDGFDNGFVWPLGIIPLSHFANRRDNYTPFGESEIRVVLPLQDMVNATLYDMQMASKLSAFKIYWSIGMEIDKDGIVPGSVVNLVLKDKNGNIVTEMPEEATEFLKAVRVGEFGTTDMSQYTTQLDKLEREISQVSSTPVYGITSQGNLSGEALKQLESGLVGKVQRFQRENSDALVMLLRLTARIQQEFQVKRSFGGKIGEAVAAFFGLDAPDDPPKSLGSVSVNWRSPEIIDSSSQIAALSKMRLDNPGLWPDEWYRERIGGALDMTSSQIAEEGEKAKMESRNSLDMLIGGGGEVPLV